MKINWKISSMGNDEEVWYFSGGFYAEHTLGIYHVKDNRLDIIRLKYLPQILRYIQKTQRNNIIVNLIYAED